jgi:glutamine amidotransferase
LNYLGVGDVPVTNDESELRCADKIILPGVGSFGEAISNIRRMALDALFEELVSRERKPFLGICLGMQLMGTSSTEAGEWEGLGLVDGTLDRFEDDGVIKIPHVGFDQVQSDGNSKLFLGLDGENDFYFTHTFKMTSSTDIGQSYCDYGQRFVAGFEVDNIAGVQFHPELSQQNGLRLLDNFVSRF